MFGFSLQKLLVLVALVLAVWYGFKLVSRLQEARRAEAALRESAASRPSAARGNGGRAKAEDMAPCPVCRAYVPARGAANCGRADCPY